MNISDLTKASILALLSVTLLSSCASSVEVYIFSRGVPADEIERVADQLTTEGFDVKPSSIEIPESITSNSIIYSPIIIDTSDINLTQSVLSSLGYSNVSLVQGAEANHSYSKNNFGLYLINPNYTPPEQQGVSLAATVLSDLSHAYYSDCLDIESELSLFSGGVAVLAVYDWDERRSRENSLTVAGEWEADREKVALNFFEQGAMIFQHEEFSGRDTYGRYRGIKLQVKTNETAFSNCNYQYTNYF
tara:strand:- start:2511 stop:3251 length:741 start_codon:yes stop_codon:yes gene_type:complete